MWQEEKKESKGKVCGMRVIISFCQRFFSALPSSCLRSAFVLPPFCLRYASHRTLRKSLYLIKMSVFRTEVERRNWGI